MRNFKARYYIDLIENTNIPELNFFMAKELEIIKSIENNKEKIFLDLGAGHGRVIPHLSEYYKKIYAIEINPDMVKELNHRAKLYKNVHAIEGDFIQLTNLIQLENEKQVIGILQNTLGTIEGDWQDVVSEINKYSHNNHTEIIISFFKAKAMNSWGKNVLFPYIKPMIGNIDFNKSNLINGELVTDNGYTSKWWKDSEIDYIIKKINKKTNYLYESDIFKIYHLI